MALRSRGNRCRSICRDDNLVALHIIRVRADFAAQLHEQFGLLNCGQIEVRLTVSLLRPVIQQPQTLAMQPVGGPVGCHIGAMSPHTSQFLTANRLPHVLTIADIILPEDDSAVRCDDLSRYGWLFPIDFPAEVSQHGERDTDDQPQTEPQSSVSHARSSL